MSKYLTAVVGAFLLSLLPSLGYAFDGFYSQFEQLIELKNQSYNKKFERFTNIGNLLDLKDPLQAKLDPDFLNSVLFYSPENYSILLHSDKCSLYDLILTNLIKDQNGNIEELLVQYENIQDEMVTKKISREDFFNHIAFKQCSKVKTFQDYFNIVNIQRTLTTIDFELPKTQNACLQRHTDFLKDQKTPYLCFIHEQIQSIPTLELHNKSRELEVAKRFRGQVPAKTQKFIRSLCTNLQTPKIFCSQIFSRNFWEQQAEENPQHPIFQTFCPTTDHPMSCAIELNTNPQKCFIPQSQTQSLIPGPNCLELGENLLHSRLNVNYTDCPEKIRDDAIVNITRILFHFDPKLIKPSQQCHAPSALAFATLNEEVAGGKVWDNKLCYQHKIRKEEVCHPVIFGEIEDNKLSLNKAVEEILKTTHNLSNNQSCRFVASSSYRPTLLEFQSGCFVVYEESTCTATSCLFKTILNDTELTHIELKKGINYQYFPLNHTERAQSLHQQLIEKLNLKTKSIINTTYLQSIMDKHSDAIIHGIGCSQDLFPEHFTQNHLNDCDPLPFIVDGYKEDNARFSVLIRSSRDSIHTVRNINWGRLYSAVKRYQQLHPLNFWGLHALYK